MIRGFLLRGAGFVALQLGMFAVVTWLHRVDESAYFAAVRDKHALLDSTPAGRVLLVGGSNLTFGIDSERLSSALGRPVVNCSLHAALGMSFMLEEARSRMVRGDAVLLSLEYEHMRRETTSDQLYLLLEQRPASMRYLSLADVPILLDTGLIAAGRIWRRATRQLRGRRGAPAALPYARRGFNRFGDCVAHLDLPSGPHAGATIGVPTLRPWFIERLNEFDAEARSRGVTVLFSFAPVSRPAYRDAAEAFNRCADVMTADCTIPLLDSPEQACLPRVHFFDTHYHLNRAGVRSRVDRLIPLLHRRLR